MSIFFAEMIGTFLLILLGNGVTANAILPKTKGENGGWIVITAGWGFAVTLSVYLVMQISGAHLNPAITLAMLLAKKVTWAQLPLYVLGQMLGAFLGSGAVYLIYINHFHGDKPSEYKLMSFCTKPQYKNHKINFLTETVATFVLVLSVFALIDVRNEVSMSIFPLIVGFVVFSIGLSLGGTTGYAINPVRDFCPRLFHSLINYPNKHSNEWEYAWVPVFAPLLGSAFAYVVYFECLNRLI